MIEWKDYDSKNAKEDSTDCDLLNDLEVGKTYLVCTEKGAVLIKTWYGYDDGGFRTYGPSGCGGHMSDSNILYYAKFNLPEDIEALKKYDSVQKLAREVIRLKKIIRDKGGNH